MNVSNGVFVQILQYKACISQQMYVSVCMLGVIYIVLTCLLWSRVLLAAHSVRIRVLYQPLTDLGIGCFKDGISDVRISDVVPLIDDQAKGWRPWPDD